MTAPRVVCIVGKKKSGKTTTAVGLVAELVRRGHVVMTVKHGHGFDLDRAGTDSWRHRHEGGAARVLVSGPDDFAVLGAWGPSAGDLPADIESREPPLETLVARYLSDADIVVVEGFKASPFPRIEVFRSAAHAEPLYGADASQTGLYLAILTDVSSFEAACPVLDIHGPDRFAALADLVERGGAPDLPRDGTAASR